MENQHKPYIPASKTLPEVTIKAFVLGAILSIILSAANAYLRPAQATGRLRIVRGLAERVVIEEGRARAVMVDGARVDAAREVILASRVTQFHYMRHELREYLRRHPERADELEPVREQLEETLRVEIGTWLGMRNALGIAGYRARWEKVT